MTVNNIQQETIKNIMKNLKKYHKCLCVRPTGFGKTTMAVQVASKYKNIVFLYPRINIGKSAEAQAKQQGINGYFFTYSKLRQMFKNKDAFKKFFKKFNNNNSLVIYDEAHSIGSSSTSEVVEFLMRDFCPKCNYLGITATPDRTDKLDIKWHFFDGIITERYDISDAIEDGIFVKPRYVYTPLDGADLAKLYMKRINQLAVSPGKKQQLKQKVSNIIRPDKMSISNLPEIIASNMVDISNDDNYYKFIVFFSSFKDIHAKKKYISDAFKSAFPECDINIIIVSSETVEFRKNLAVVDSLSYRKNTVDLIFNIDMLTFGYHVEDITGVLMFRSTISNIVYNQQIGRVLSVMQKTKTIVFDFVENLHNSISALFDIEKDTNDIDVDTISPIIKMIAFDDDILELNTIIKDILDIERLVHSAITEEYEDEVVDAYNAQLVDSDYCIAKLNLHSLDDFKKILDRKGVLYYGD